MWRNFSSDEFRVQMCFSNLCKVTAWLALRLLMVSFVPVVLLVRWLDAKMDGLSGVNKLIVLTAFHDDFFIAHSGCFFLGGCFSLYFEELWQGCRAVGVNSCDNGLLLKERKGFLMRKCARMVATYHYQYVLHKYYYLLLDGTTIPSRLFWFSGEAPFVLKN